MRSTKCTIFLLICVSLVNITQSDDVILNRLNFGVMTKLQGRVSIVHGYWNHVYCIRLPDRRPRLIPRPINMTRCQDTQYTQTTTAYRTSRQLTATMRNAITALVTRIYMLTGIQRPTPARATGRINARSRRGVIDLVGDASSWLFGTATVQQINEIRELLTQVKTSADLTATDSKRIRSSLSTFEKLENKRMDDLHTVLNIEPSIRKPS